MTVAQRVIQSAWWRGLALSLVCLLPFSCAGDDAECKNDSDCPAGRYCRVNECFYDCTHDSECPADYRCSERGRCERGCRRTNDGVEACDGLDNNCDGQTDELFPDKGFPCQNGACPAGSWVCSADGGSLICDGQVPTESDMLCNGLDDDCDGQTDEDVLDQPCPLQAGVCADAMSTCLATGEMSVCDYGADYQEGLDDSCNGVDNDCDGLTDEDATVLPMGEFGPQATDGLDNNCNGLVDEPGGVMIKVDDDFAIDAYEATLFSNSECTGSRYGYPHNDYPAGFPAEGTATATMYACSLPDVFPSGFLSWHRAGWACEAQGKRLCTADEFEKACIGPEYYRYPYGGAFFSGWCNDGWAAESQLSQTGSFPICSSGYGAWDMSGNLGEWVQDYDSDQVGNAMVGGGYYTCYLCYPTGGCVSCDRGSDSHHDHVKLSLDCSPGSSSVNNEFDSFLRSRVEAFLGTRCCMDL